FVKTVRFNEACRLLKEDKYNVAEISYRVGFSTPSYFTAAFKQFMGCTPREWVKKDRKG
ncbi:MAG: helix-turn-helix transcriptional regulator, partial [Bacteroidales bacterium]|nr:helix-turn-helix transcriptional regulator [Bacteroidales bacterium]